MAGRIRSLDIERLPILDASAHELRRNAPSALLGLRCAPSRTILAAYHKIFVLVLALSGVVDYYITKSPKYLDDSNQAQEIAMNTTLSTKLAALGLALVINSVIMGSVALMFNARLQAAPVQTVASIVDSTGIAA